MTHPEPTPDTEERPFFCTACDAPIDQHRLVCPTTPPQAVPVDGLRQALLVELAASIPGTCDWGGCDNNALLARHDAERGWLGVCQWHAADASSGDLAPITAVAFEDAWNCAALATASAPGLDVETLRAAIHAVWMADGSPLGWPPNLAERIYARLRESTR